MGRVGFTTRTLALFLDCLILAIISAVSFFICFKYFPNVLGKVETGEYKGLPQLPLLVSTIASLAYLFIELFCASPGKLLFGLYIGDRAGNQSSLMRRILRLSCKLPGIVILAIFLLTLGAGYGLSSVSKEFGSSMMMFGLTLLPIAGFANLISTLGCFMALSYSQETLHDRLSGTGIFYGPIPTEEVKPTRVQHYNQMPPSPEKSNLAVNKLLFK